jgi:chemotaxis protein MotB
MYSVRNALLITGLALLATGCVTKGKYDDAVAERDRLQGELAAATEYNQALESRVEGLSVSQDELAAELAATEAEVASLRGTYDDLVGELEAEVTAGQIQIEQLVDGVRVGLSDEILFPSGSATLNAQGRDVLTRVASKISGDGAIITVEGHTDNVRISKKLMAQYPTNWELAGARAASVVRLLSEAGVDPKSLRAVSRGPFAPVASNDTREGRAKNRRTEILLRPVPR